MTQTDQQNAPKLRFPGFERAWEASFLGKQCDITTGRLDANAMIEDGQYPFFTCARDVYKIDTPAFDTEALLISGNGANVGYIHYYNGKFNAYQRTYVLDGFTQDIRFTQRNLERGLKKRIFSEVKEGNTPYIVKGTLADMPINLPTLPEQRKIAGFLGAVDEKIAHLSRKKALLENYKKGCMQQLFSQKIRFKDDDGKDFPAWEEKRLGEVASFSRGKGISKADIEDDGENTCVRYGELYTEYQQHIGHVVSKTNTPLKGAVLSKKNDVLMPTSDVTPNGLATASALDIEGVILGGDILIIRSKKILNLFFAYFVAANKPKIIRLVSGVTVYHIYGSDLATLHLAIPHPTEQRKIADFLSALDRKINLVAQELTHARTFKAGLLQQMFV